MTGVKGRSGRVKDAEHHRAKQLAAVKGGRAKAGHVDREEDDTVKDAEFVSIDDILGLLPGANPYDRVVLSSKGRFTYLDGKTREQVNGERLSNEKRQVEIDKERKRLLTVEEIEARDEWREELFLSALSGVSDFVADLVPPEGIQRARQLADAWINKVRISIAKSLAERGEIE